jgi:hypothetical protein
MKLLAAFALCTSVYGDAPSTPCTADEDCIGAGLRCLPSPGGAPCTLDYKYNETGFCACLPQSCESFSYPPATPGKKQWLVWGDSISMGYTGPLRDSAKADFDVWHVGSSKEPINCDNAYFASRCMGGWLGENASRWDVVSYNAGLHDLAFPDNEHLSTTSYSAFLQEVLAYLGKALRPDATLLWMTTTPVPSSPPPNCTLIPGRVESSVLAYNAAAAEVVAKLPSVKVCDLHAAITAYCGVGYSSCNISQCAGPHFTSEGWQLLATTAEGCLGGQR